MKIISILTWVASHKAIALCYADLAASLSNKVDDTDIVSGSIAYVGNGKCYVYNGSQWNEMGA